MNLLKKENVFYCVIIFLLCVFVILLDLILGKIFIPGDAAIRAQNDYYHHGLRPNKKIKSKWAGEKYWLYTNSLGMRDGAIREIRLEPGKYRMVFAGDSFTEGLGVPYEQTFVGIMDKVESQKGVEVLNAGVVSYSPKLHYLRIKHLLDSGFKFNELFVFLDISDVQDEILYSNFAPVQKSSKAILRSATEKIVNDWLLPHSYLYRNLYLKFKNGLNRILIKTLMKDKIGYQYWAEKDTNKIRPKWTSDQAAFEKWGKKGLALAEENMDKLFKLCGSRGIKLVIAVYPWTDQIKERDPNSLQAGFWESYCHKRNIAFINLFPDFINENSDRILENYFIRGDNHWNYSGHQFVADKILEKSKELGLKLQD